MRQYTAVMYLYFGIIYIYIRYARVELESDNEKKKRLCMAFGSRHQVPIENEENDKLQILTWGPG